MKSNDVPESKLDFLTVLNRFIDENETLLKKKSIASLLIRDELSTGTS